MMSGNTNHFIFRRPAALINAEGAVAGMKKEYNPTH
jgi:hypothetical protein